MLIKKFLSLAVCTALISPTCIIAGNFNQKVSGKGSAIIEGDVETTQNNAMVNAKTNLVLSALNRLLGTKITESDEMFSSQLPAILEQFDNFAEITSDTPTRDGASFIINLTANLNEVEFRSLLKDLGVGLNQQAREVGSIVIFFDETEKPYDQPQDMFNEYINYKRDNSDIYKERNSASSSKASASALSVKDKSSGAYSNKTALSAKSTNQAAYSDQYAGKASSGYSGSSGYSNGYGSGSSGGAGYSDAAVASSSKGSAKSTDSLKTASSTKSAFKNDYEKKAATASAASSKASHNVDDIHMDKEEFTYKKEYREIKESTAKTGAAKAEMVGILQEYGLKFIDGSGKLSEFNKVAKTKYASYSEVVDSAESTKFKEYVLKTTKADFMGVAYSQINYALKTDETTGQYGCTSTQSNVNIFSLKDGGILKSGALDAVKQSDSNIEGCKTNAKKEMAVNLAHKIGLSVQKQVRDDNKAFDSGPATFEVYTIVLRGSLDRLTRRSFEGIMETQTDQMKSYQKLEENGKEYRYKIAYKGTSSVGDYLLDKAVALNSAFNSYDVKKESSNTVVLYPTK